KSPLFQSLGCADNGSGAADISSKLRVDAATVPGRHYAQYDLSACGRGAQLRSNRDIIAQAESRQKNIVFTRARDSLRQVGFKDPQPDLVKSRCQHDRQRRPPTSAANDRQSHELLQRNFLSVPAWIRSRLSLCRYMMNPPAMKATMTRVGDGCEI